MRLIDLDELLKYPIRLDHYDKENGNIHFVFGVESVLEYAEYLPIIDAVPVKHGKWIDGYILDEPVEVCSECSTFYMLKFSGGGMRYCPNCGAKMDGREEE